MKFSGKRLMYCWVMGWKVKKIANNNSDSRKYQCSYHFMERNPVTSKLQSSTIQWGPLNFHWTRKGSPRSKFAHPNGKVWGPQTRKNVNSAHYFLHGSHMSLFQHMFFNINANWFYRQTTTVISAWFVDRYFDQQQYAFISD